MKIFYLVWNEESGYTKYKHEDIHAAQKEAERLANLYPGKEFHILLALSKVRVNNVVWDKSNEHTQIEFNLPF
jgi:hypothetical protein